MQERNVKIAMTPGSHLSKLKSIILKFLCDEVWWKWTVVKFHNWCVFRILSLLLQKYSSVGNSAEIAKLDGILCLKTNRNLICFLFVYIPMVGYDKGVCIMQSSDSHFHCLLVCIPLKKIHLESTYFYYCVDNYTYMYSVCRPALCIV